MQLGTAIESLRHIGVAISRLSVTPPQRHVAPPIQAILPFVSLRRSGASHVQRLEHPTSSSSSQTPRYIWELAFSNASEAEKVALVDGYLHQYLKPILDFGRDATCSRWLRGAISAYLASFDPSSPLTAKLGSFLAIQIGSRSDALAQYWTNVHQDFVVFSPIEATERISDLLRSRRETISSIARRLTLASDRAFFATGIAKHVHRMLLFATRSEVDPQGIAVSWNFALQAARVDCSDPLMVCIEYASDHLLQHRLPRSIEDSVLEVLGKWSAAHLLEQKAKQLTHPAALSFYKWYATQLSPEISLYVVIESSDYVEPENLEAIRDAIDQLRAVAANDFDLRTSINASIYACTATGLRPLLVDCGASSLALDTTFACDPGRLSLTGTIDYIRNELAEKQAGTDVQSWRLRPVVLLFLSGVFADEASSMSAVTDLEADFFARCHAIFFGNHRGQEGRTSAFDRHISLTALTAGAFRSILKDVASFAPETIRMNGELDHDFASEVSAQATVRKEVQGVEVAIVRRDDLGGNRRRGSTTNPTPSKSDAISTCNSGNGSTAALQGGASRAMTRATPRLSLHNIIRYSISSALLTAILLFASAVH